jgi:hypothetical protein
MDKLMTELEITIVVLIISTLVFICLGRKEEE